MAELNPGTRVRIVKNNVDTDAANYIGMEGTLIMDDGSAILPLTVRLDGEHYGIPFDRDEVIPTGKEPTAPMTKAILGHLKKVGNISGSEADTIYKCRALPRRIADLKELGWNIQRELRNDATGQRYARYTLEMETA